MKTQFAGRADVHGWTLAHGFHAAQDFDRVGGVVSVGCFAVLVLRVVLSVDALAINEFGLQFFRGHSAPWRMPDPTPDRTPDRRDDSGTARVPQLIEFSAI